MIEESGECSFEEANSINIPVDIWLMEEEDEENKKTGRWVLFAANYRPRGVGMIVPKQYHAVADTREELVELIRKHVIPLYANAMAALNAICEGRRESLYHWD